MDAIADRMQRQLVEKYGASRVNLYDIPVARAASDKILKKAAEECDAAIVGLAN